jgi:hypothetical protein
MSRKDHDFSELARQHSGRVEEMNMTISQTASQVGEITYCRHELADFGAVREERRGAMWNPHRRNAR